MDFRVQLCILPLGNRIYSDRNSGSCLSGGPFNTAEPGFSVLKFTEKYVAVLWLNFTLSEGK